ncbi:C1 family peptidase [Bacteroidota bacterium]
MKAISLFIVIAVFSMQLQAKNTLKKGIINPEYIKYIEKVKSGEVKTVTKDGHGLGFMPSPLYYSEAPEYIKTEESSKKLKDARVIPSSYDIRDYNLSTSVKDQGPQGACWTFGAIAAIESNWIKRGIGTTFDLSEENMANCHPFVPEKNEGGTFEMATTYLISEKGPVLESFDPYQPNVASAVCKAGTPEALITEGRILLYNEEIIKKAILDYGGVATAINMGDYERYYNASDYTYHYGGNDYADHAILIVGWDDNKVVTGGSDSPDGTHTGAWIIKNSWGDDFGDDGFAYVSYDDNAIAVVSAYWPSYEDPDEYDNIYYYDELGAIWTIAGAENGGYGLVKFEASGKEHVKKIGTWIVAQAVTIDIEIYDTKDGNTLSDLRYSETGIRCSHYGYYTVDVSAIVEDDFYVKINYQCPYRGDIIPIETKVTDYALPWIERDLCWVSSDGEDWTEVGDGIENYEYDLCIKAYTVSANDPQASFVADKERICIDATVSFTDNSDGTITSWSWDFGAGASPQTANTAGPHDVTYSSAGLKTVSLTVSGTGGDNTLTRTDFIHVTEDINVEIPYRYINVGKDETFTLSAFGADSYVWSPSTSLDQTTGAEVTTTASYDSIEYTVTGTQGSCSDIAIVKVFGRENEWDDICDAIELEVGSGVYNGPFHNIYATVEIDEPHPPFNDCNTQNSWCDEYVYTAPGKTSLENSVWFKFSGTSSGSASIQLISAASQYYADAQIAVYRASSCNDLIGAEWIDVGIAANDDYFDNNNSTDDYFNLYSAAIDLRTGFDQGNTYWIQVDGSGGGNDVIFYIEISESEVQVYEEPLGVKENIISGNDFFSIYPNPNNGSFNFTYNGDASTNLIIDIFSASGERLYKNEYGYIVPGFNKDISLKSLSSGIYFIRFNTNNEYQLLKMIIK